MKSRNGIEDPFILNRVSAMLNPMHAHENFDWYGQTAYDPNGYPGRHWNWNKLTEMLQVALEVIHE